MNLFLKTAFFLTIHILSLPFFLTAAEENTNSKEPFRMKNKLKIGWASRDVSTSRPVAIHGQFHIRISQGVRDPLTVTALAVDNGEESFLMLSCDVTSLNWEIVRQIRKQVAERVPVPAEKIIMNATHTHTAGDIGMLHSARPGIDFPVDDSLTLMPSEEYRKLFCDAAADALADAWNSRKEGAVAWGSGYAVTGHNRRVCFFTEASDYKFFKPIPNGTSIMYGPTNSRNFSHYETGSDSTVNLLFTFDGEEKLTGAVINIACPSQCSEMEEQLSADFWFEVKNNLKKKYGNIRILPQCAAAGDLSPRTLHNKKAEQRRLKLKKTTIRQEIADRITDVFSEVLSWAKNDIRHSASLKNHYEVIQVPLRPWSALDCLQDWIFKRGADGTSFKTEGSPEQRFKENSIVGGMKAGMNYISSVQGRHWRNENVNLELHAVVIDDIAFITNPFELYMDYMHRIQARSPFTQTFIVQLAGDEQSRIYHGYLPTERAEQGLGYSAVRYTSPVGHEGGQLLVEKSLDALNRLAEEK